jgi:hypothetical protein
MVQKGVGLGKAVREMCLAQAQRWQLINFSFSYSFFLSFFLFSDLFFAVGCKR